MPLKDNWIDCCSNCRVSLPVVDLNLCMLTGMYYCNSCEDDRFRTLERALGRKEIVGRVVFILRVAAAVW